MHVLRKDFLFLCRTLYLIFNDGGVGSARLDAFHGGGAVRRVFTVPEEEYEGLFIGVS